MKTKKSFATPSAKPVDVEYRLKRLRESLEAAEMFLSAIDPVALGFEGRRHAEVRDQILAVLNTANGLVAPAKKARGKKAAAEAPAEEAE